MARLGAWAPLSAEFLRATAPGYWTSRQKADAPEDWFEQALNYATEELHGAVAALSPKGASPGQIAGYTVADYLLERARKERRYARVPAEVWDAAIRHTGWFSGTVELANSARSRLLLRRPGRLCVFADSGDDLAAYELVQLLVSRGDLDALRTRADAGNQRAAFELVLLLIERNQLDELRARADDGCWYAAYGLAECNDLDELRARAGDGDLAATLKVIPLLAGRGELDTLRSLADAAGIYRGLAAKQKDTATSGRSDSRRFASPTTILLP